VGTLAALHARERSELAREPRLVVVPEATHGIDVVVGPPPAGAERHADGLVLTGDITHADTDEEPALGQHVDRGQLLRQNHRIAQREDHNACTELHPRRPRRGVGQHGHRVEHLAVGRQRGRPNLGVDQHRVLPHPYRLVPEVLGRPRDLGNSLGVGECARADPEPSDIDHLPPPLTMASQCHRSGGVSDPS